MESERSEELILFAESIANDDFFENKTDLVSIINKKGITMIKGNYESFFLGSIVHELGEFYLYLNNDLLKEDQNTRIRFTLAHELGHYFIDEHRNLLEQGISLSFTKKDSSYYIEKEANHFASFLLMPRERFILRASQLQFGIQGILSLSKEFETSIDSTSIHYVKLNCCKGILIRWNEDLSIRFSSVSESLSKQIKHDTKPIIQFIESHLHNIKNEFNEQEDKNEIIEKATHLSKWIETISENSSYNLLALEQTLKLGNYGGLTLVTIN